MNKGINSYKNALKFEYEVCGKPSFIFLLTVFKENKF